MAGEDVRDIIAIGGSAGAIEAVSTIVRALPPTLPAAVAVVVHHYQRAPNIFGKILDSLQTLPATTVEDEAPLEHGRIYVPSSDRHLTIAPGSLHAIRTAKENRARPAIDPLFRSAAKAYGRRVVGVVLTGNLDDGAAGLMAIKRAGGLAVVQDPADAMFSGMPRNALEMVEVDFRVRLVEIAALLTTAAEGKMASKRPAAGNGQPPAGPGDLMVFTCPTCHGTLRETADDNVLHYACHTGHTFGLESLMASQDDDLEMALWTALRVLREKVFLLDRLGKRADEHSSQFMRERHETERRRLEHHVATLRRVLETG